MGPETPGARGQGTRTAPDGSPESGASDARAKAQDAATMLRAMVDARRDEPSREGAHLLVDVVLVACTLPERETALYAAERLHELIDALDPPPGSPPG